MLKIIELSVKGQSYGFYDEISFVCDSIINYLVEFIDETFNENDEPLSIDELADFIRKNINPNYKSWGDVDEEDVCYIMMRNSWYQLEYLMNYIKEDYLGRDEDKEVYAALCFCKWILNMNSRCIEMKDIAQKYKNIKDFVSTIK